MLEVCLLSPAPALWVGPAGAEAAWQTNPACAAWPPAAGWGRADWQRLADVVRQATAHDDMRGEDTALSVQWQAVALEPAAGGGWLAWLAQPAPVAPRPGPQSIFSAVQLELATGLMGMSMWRIDLAERRIRANGWGFEMAGVHNAPEEGMSLDELRTYIHPDDLPRVAEATEAALQPGTGSIDVQARYHQPDGSYRTLYTRRIAERDEEGRAVGLIGVSFDISAQVEAQQREQAAMLGMRVVTEATGVGVWSADMAQRTLTWHGEMQGLLGHPHERTMLLADAQRFIEARTVAADLPVVRESFQSLDQPGFEAGEWTFRVRRRTAAGAEEQRWLASRVRRFERDGVRETFGTIFDVTQQREAQDRLRRAEQRTALAAQFAGFAVWELDLVTGERYWDEQMYRLRGLDPADPRSMETIRLATLHPDDVQVFEDFRRRVEGAAIRGEAPPGEVSTLVEFRVVWPDGSVRWLSSRASVLQPEGRNPVLLGMHWDITNHKHAEDLRRQRTAAEEANRAKSQFLANMSHEIRTPMNAILGMSHLALKSGLNAQQHNYVAKVERSAQSLLGVINDILDFSKIEAGKLDLEHVAFQLGDVMDNLASVVGLQAEDKGIELLFVEAPDLPMALLGDPLRLGQVLVNLGSNAVKFTERGEVVVAVDRVPAADVATGRVALRFSVRDTGVGMHADQLERLFQPFTQADASTSRRHGGTGLGLAISHRLVDMMGGHLHAHSTPGAGSTFSFTLHFGVQQAAAGRDQPARLQPPAEARQPLPRARVLVVDDNATAREILLHLARAFGLEASEAADGFDALRAVSLAAQRGEPFDLVLLDWKMPGMDGVQCAAQLARGSHERRPLVVMTTAFGRDEVLQRLNEVSLKVSDVLVKPVTPSTLFDACNVALRQTSRADSRIAVRKESLSAHRAQLHGAHILLVEDNLINQELAFELLTEAGIVVTIAEDGQQALDLLATQRFDGVLMDCQMPVLDGYAATREIRRQPQWQALPVIAMTANAMAGDREHALAAGMNDHIAKPIDVEAMFETVARWVRPAA
jgi:signal transduction histidine kinase/DNA-binding response OmpR family regulator